MSRPGAARMRRRNSRMVYSSVERLGPDAPRRPRRRRLGHELAGDRVTAIQPDPSELADVPEPELPAVGQLEDEPDVRVFGQVRRHDEQLAGHLEMDRQRGVPAEVDHDLLGPAADGQHLATGDRVPEDQRIVRAKGPSP